MGRFIRSHVLAVTLYTLGGLSAAHSQQPAWYNEPQFFNTYLNGYVVSYDPDITLVPFTGQAWGFGFDVYPATSTEEPLQQEVAAWKVRNGVYFATLSVETIYFSQAVGPDPAWDAFRMRSLNGNYLDHYDTRLWTFANYSLSSPVFQNFLIRSAQQAVDAGADGLQVDNVQWQLGAMLYYTAAEAGSFDAITMGAFRAYLQQKYSASVLASQFGVADITAFNFASYIQAHGLSNTWNQYPLTGLSLEFFLFKRQESLNFLRNLVTRTKQYAQQKYGRNFLFTCNDGDDPLGYFVTEVMDQTTPELFYIQGMDHPFGAIDVKSWTGWKRPTIPLAETAPPGLSGVTNPLTGSTVNLERVIIADIQAAGGMAGAQLQMNEGFNQPKPVDLSVMNRYANFILANPQLMSQTTTPAHVALLHSAPSVLGGVLPMQGQNSPWNGPTNYTGMARLLLDRGFTYDAVFLPDTTYSQLAPLQVADLAKYSVVIAPSTFSLDDNQEATLLAYAQQGGTLIIDGDFATNEPSGAPASHPELGPILAAPGQTAYGAGQIVFSKELFGVEYQATSGGTLPGVDNAAERQARASFQTFMTPYIQPDVQVTQPPAQIYEPGITPFMYHDRARNTLVHLVNYDYDLATDQFYTKTNIQVQVQVGSQAVDEVILRSPDFTGAQALPFTRSGGTITVNVPEVDAWVVLYFQQNAFAPAINSVSPSPALGAVGGSSLSFTVNASDPDGNPLTYTWSVNGQLVTNVFGPAYSLRLPLTASGIYTVKVTVTDGSRITQTSWTINVAAYRSPRVLFDETHSERYTLNAARAQQLNPQNPTWVLFSILRQALAPDYQVTDLLTGTSGSLTAQLLSGTDVLVLAAPATPLTTAENQAITQFVQAGGGLIFLVDTGSDTAINKLVGPWGLQFDPTLIESLQTPACAPCFYLSSFANNPAVGANPSFFTDYSGSFSVSQDAVALAQTSSAEWKSTSGQPTQQPGEPNGPFVMIAAAPAGKGRVFLCDPAFVDVYLQYSGYTGNLNLFLSGLAWVSSSVNPTPAPPTPTGALAHFAAGDTWTTGFFVLNTGTSAAQFSIAFYDDNGNPVALPFSGGSTNTLSGTVAAQGSAYYEAANSQIPLAAGWGQITADPSIVVQALFRNNSNGTYYEAAVPSMSGTKEFLLPFDTTTFVGNGAPFFTGFAIANLDQATANLTCTARDPNGITIPNGVPVPRLSPLGHWANYLFPALTGRRGTIDCVSNTNIAATALRSIGANAFSSLPVVPNPSSFTSGAHAALAHFAAGDTWTTGFFVLNTGTSAAQFSIAFYDDNGNPAALPFSGGSTNTLSGTVAAQGSAYYEAANAQIPLAAGWGQTTADPSIVVQALFRNDSNGTYYEAAVPSSSGSKEFLLPFDATTFAANGSPFFTGFAVANLDQTTATVTCTARDSNGGIIPNAVLVPSLSPLGHWANYLFPALTGNRGTIDCVSNTNVAAIALRSIGSSAFSSLPVIAK